MDPSPLERRRDPDDLAQSDEARDEITPRPGHSQNHETYERIPSSAPSTSGHSTSCFKYRNSMSSRSSSRQIRNAEINQTGFRMGSFILDTYPESLHTLRDVLYDIGVGHGILPASLKNKLQNVSSRIPPSAFDETEAKRAQTEAIAADLLLIGWVQSLMTRAAECEIHRECEAAWNREIQAKILEQAFQIEVTDS
ncbi:hypothetical protein BFJ71_g16167 [Fusarium oxysporum]|nr:hypothetical protein BFJ71_g16167 [Fusarium oxysporum]